MRKRLLLTGCAGFSGPHIAQHILHGTDWEVIGLDRLSYAGSLERLRSTREEFGDRFKFVFHDFRAAFPSSVLHMLEGVSYVIHAGAETHVERSLQNPLPFVESNVLGTLHVLNAARNLGVEHFILVSTDEVHGPAPDGVSFGEGATIRPSNPYSATKAGAEGLAYSYWKSYRLPVTITRTMNLFGEMQHPEKFIPMCIRKIRDGEVVTIHGTPDGKSGSRKWLHARNQADALLFLLKCAGAHDYTLDEQLWYCGHDPIVGETFHIAGEEHTNLEIAQFIAADMGKELRYELVDFHRTRPGHDARYSLDDSKLRSTGWHPPVEFRESLRRTVEWTLRKENEKWLLP